MSSKAKRSNRWAFVVYPDDGRLDGLLDGGVSGLVDFLESLHVAAAVSPLHDRDRQDDGTAKKPHYHVILEFSSLKSYEQVIGLLEPLHVNYVEAVNNRASYTRYLAHMDSPKKAQYEPDGIVSVLGYNLDCLESLNTLGEERRVRREVVDFIRANAVTSLSELYNALEDEGASDDMLDYVVKRSYFFNNYLKSVGG